jgi:hypothetical protein
MAWEGRGSQAMNAARLVLLLLAAVASGRVGGASILHPLRPHDVMGMNLTKVPLAPHQILTILHHGLASSDPRVRNLAQRNPRQLWSGKELIGETKSTETELGHGRAESPCGSAER